MRSTRATAAGERLFATRDATWCGMSGGRGSKSVQWHAWKNGMAACDGGVILDDTPQAAVPGVYVPAGCICRRRACWAVYVADVGVDVARQKGKR